MFHQDARIAHEEFGVFMLRPDQIENAQSVSVPPAIIDALTSTNSLVWIPSIILSGIANMSREDDTKGVFARFRFNICVPWSVGSYYREGHDESMRNRGYPDPSGPSQPTPGTSAAARSLAESRPVYGRHR